MPDDRATSRFLSLILRHRPELVGLTLDPAGWVGVPELLAALAAHGRPLSRAGLEALVAESDKQRYALDPATDRIRANQGHSVEVELGHAPADPPATLLHGTSTKFLASIRATGLVKRDRHHVHLTADPGSARAVGARHGKAVVLEVDAAGMVAAGHTFALTPNGVWLTDAVPTEFLRFPEIPTSRNDLAARADTTLAAVARGAYEGPDGPVALGPLIARAVAGSRVWTAAEIDALALPSGRAGRVTVDDRSTLQALHDLRDTPGLGALNFASAKNPGGGFRTGAVAQEESLARASALAACLEACPSYYAANRANSSMIYLDLLQHAPAVPFFRDDAGAWRGRPTLADVITAPAPNAGAHAQHGGDPSEVRPALARRAGLVLRLAAGQGIGTLVLGAWGCGVFRNDPAVVAGVFAELLADDALRSAFDALVFAVYDPRPGQPALLAFRAAFGG